MIKKVSDIKIKKLKESFFSSFNMSRQIISIFFLCNFIFILLLQKFNPQSSIFLCIFVTVMVSSLIISFLHSTSDLISKPTIYGSDIRSIIQNLKSKNFNFLELTDRIASQMIADGTIKSKHYNLLSKEIVCEILSFQHPKIVSFMYRVNKIKENEWYIICGRYDYYDLLNALLEQGVIPKFMYYQKTDYVLPSDDEYKACYAVVLGNEEDFNFANLSLSLEKDKVISGSSIINEIKDITTCKKEISFTNNTGINYSSAIYTSNSNYSSGGGSLGGISINQSQPAAVINGNLTVNGSVTVNKKVKKSKSIW